MESFTSPSVSVLLLYLLKSNQTYYKDVKVETESWVLRLNETEIFLTHYMS